MFDFFGVRMFAPLLLTFVLFGTSVAGNPCVAVQLGDVTLKMIDGSTVKGTLDKIDEKGLLSGQNLPADCRIDQVASVVTGRPLDKRSDSLIEVRLVGGGVVFAHNVSISDDKILVERSGSEKEMLLELVQGVVWRNTEKTDSQLQSRATENDAVMVATDSGERVVLGILEGLDATHVKINFRGESRKIAISKVNALVVADLQLPAAKGVVVTVKQVDGTTVTGALRDLVDGSLNLAPIANSNISIPANEIVSIEVQSDRVVYLSDLDPVDVQQRPDFTVPRPWKRNKSIEGNPLTLMNRTTGETTVYSNGLGTQAYTALTFENKGNFDRFQATVGIDAETMGHGDCELVIQGDGIQLWSKRVRGSDAPEVLSVDISGMKEIILMVRAGEQFDLADHADWCEARFVKSQ